MTVTQEKLAREQERLLPTGDLAPYAGQWVAIRDGRVVANDLDPVSLRNQPGVGPDDVFWHVPAPHEGGVYIL